VVLSDHPQPRGGIARRIGAEKRLLFGLGVGGDEKRVHAGEVAVGGGAGDLGRGRGALHGWNRSFGEELTRRRDQRLTRARLLIDPTYSLIWYGHPIMVYASYDGGRYKGRRGEDSFR
jgi:hypothetical protein